MKGKHYLLVVLILSSLNINAQENTRRLTFVLLIDNEVVNPIYIDDTYFVMVDETKNDSVTIPFDFTVGSIFLKDSDYHRLFSMKTKNSLFVHFNYTKSISPYLETIEYNKSIPVDWINDTYIVFYVYNYFNKESRKKYDLKKSGYGIEIRIPGYGTIIPRWKKP